jgi:hypothetical protein
MKTRTPKPDALAKIPPRNAVCLDCRTALVDGEACDAGRKHRVVSLAKDDGRKKLVDEVWGPANVRRQIKRAARAGSGGATFGGMFDGCGSADCSGCDVPSGGGDVIAFILVAIVGAIVMVIVGWLILALVRYIRDKLDRPKPFGALARTPALRGRGVAGKVVAAARADSPASDDPCVAFALEYRCRRVISGAVMLHDAATRGFDVVTKDGRKVRVPAGRIRLDGVFARVGSNARARAAAHLETIDPSRDPNLVSVEDGTTDPFPFDDVVQAVVRPGDEVEVLGELAPIADPDASTGSAYRESAGMLVPVGVAYVRVVSTNS